MRWLILIVAVNCGKSSGPAPSATGSSAPPVARADAGSAMPPVAVPDASAAAPTEAPPPTGAAEPCEPTLAAGIEGSHDRYPFEDPKTERAGYKTKAGAIVIPAKFAEATPFSPGGVATVRLDEDSPNPWRFIDPTGNVIATPHKVDNGPDYFQEGFARIVDASGKMGFIDLAGKIVIAPQYDFAYPFCAGVSKVTRGKNSSYVDPAGRSIAGPKDDDRPAIPPSHVD